MNALVLYESQFGNTEKIAEAIALAVQEHMPTRLASVAEVKDLHAATANVDLLVIGGPTQKHGLSPGLRHLVRGLGHGALQGVKAATFDTRLHGPKVMTGSAATTLRHRLRRAGATMLVEEATFAVAGTEGPLDPGEVERARRFAEQLAKTAELRGTAP